VSNIQINFWGGGGNPMSPPMVINDYVSGADIILTGLPEDIGYLYITTQQAGQLYQGNAGQWIHINNLTFFTHPLVPITDVQYDSDFENRMIIGGHDIAQFDSDSADYMCIGGDNGRVFYESESIDITSHVVYCFGKDANNNITPPVTTIALQITRV
jgi:hypothetical protein